MAEKGGKGYSQPNVGKSALKTPSSFLGKDNSSAKSKRGMNVQFESDANLNFSPRYGGKGDTPISKDGWGKGGKGGKIANGVKSPVKKPIPPLELRVEEGARVGEHHLGSHFSKGTLTCTCSREVTKGFSFEKQRDTLEK